MRSEVVNQGHVGLGRGRLASIMETTPASSFRLAKIRFYHRGPFSFDVQRYAREAVAWKIHEDEALVDQEKLSFLVWPGVLEVFTRLRRPNSAFIAEDFPTLERPAKAISIRPV